MKHRTLSSEQLHEFFDDYLNEIVGNIKIGTLEYTASETLKAVDAIAYNEELHNFMSINQIEFGV